MRRLLVLGMTIALGTWARPVHAQSYPAEMVITVPEVEVRSGPSSGFFATSKLRAGDRVYVRRESEKQKGWLAITPPPGSFSWILETHVERNDPYTGVVKATEPVSVRPGSSLSNNAPDVDLMKIPQGAILTILDGPMTGKNGEKWLPIKAHITEVRYIPADAVKAQQFASNPARPNAVPVVFANNSVVAQADQAFKANQLDRARQLYNQAYPNLTDYNQKVHVYNRLVSLSGNTQWQAGNLNNTKAVPTSQVLPPANTARYIAPGVPGRAQWSNWGYLRTTAITKEGQPMYVLENKQGQPLQYVLPAQGLSLRDYVGKTVALFGTVSYSANDYLRREYLTVTHLAKLP